VYRSLDGKCRIGGGTFNRIRPSHRELFIEYEEPVNMLLLKV
jgi:hypothetical protein